MSEFYGTSFKYQQEKKKEQLRQDQIRDQQLKQQEENREAARQIARMLKELKKQLEEARVGRIDKGSRKRINSREEHEELRNNYQRVLDTYWSNVNMANNVDSDYE
ncbi:hypothetical protein F8M41_025078 [Gigaspora margarita]|uniref:Uncharacterized protein n=1 Tax=Gigaspora margarita TaxID=4874 RepID=A0A8H4ET93_GIGMA|nr:hypothetical protein F8M41_025078 [Gigaspora margarita]